VLEHASVNPPLSTEFEQLAAKTFAASFKVELHLRVVIQKGDFKHVLSLKTMLE